MYMVYQNKNYIDNEDEIFAKSKLKFLQKVLNLKIEVSQFISSISLLKIFAP